MHRVLENSSVASSVASLLNFALTQLDTAPIV